MIQSLIESGKLKINNNNEKITFHDPCYLARHNNILEEPRQTVSVLGTLVEMQRKGKASFCCGGGGGNYWAEEEGTKINQTRAKEALETDADIIATACPFCLLMMTDGLKKYTETDKTFDIAELVSMNLTTNE